MFKRFSPARHHFACHSLGKYSALTAIADILPNSLFVDIVFYHSLIMQHSVKLKDVANSCYDSAVEKQKAEGYIVLEYGLTMIPLAGLDVPFHSRQVMLPLVWNCTYKELYGLDYTSAIPTNVYGPHDN